jgi:hypothetical protein
MISAPITAGASDTTNPTTHDFIELNKIPNIYGVPCLVAWLVVSRYLFWGYEIGDWLK